MAIAAGSGPATKSVLAPKVPSPLPSSTETVLVSKFAVARSGLPSPFRSPTATPLLSPPVSKERKAEAKRGLAGEVAKFVRSSNSERAMDADRADVISTPIEVLLERAGCRQPTI